MNSTPLSQCWFWLILTAVTAFVYLAGCYNSHQVMEKSDLFTGESLPLPESFVSVSIKRYFVQNVPLAGGFLIHPGVILTNLSHAEHLLKESEKASLKDHLHLTFNLQNASPKNKAFSVKVQKAVPLGSRKTLSLLFFEPHDKLAHIEPVPIATTEDIQHIGDAVGGNLRAVGMTAENALEQRPNCPRSVAHARLIQTEFPISSEQLGWALEIIEAFPGVIEPYLMSHRQKKLMNLSGSELKGIKENPQWGELWFFPEKESRALRKERTHYYSAAMCSLAGFCTEFVSSPHPAVQCVQHLGYPVLWQSPSGKWKALGISHHSWYSVGGELSVLAHVITPDIMNRSIHIDLVQFHNDIKFQLASAAKQSDFKLDHQVIDRLDHSTEQALKNNQHLDFLTGLANEHSPGVYHTSCLGALIDKGVMITAGHCLIQTDSSKSYVTLKDDDQQYLVRAQKFLVHPTYRAAMVASKPSDTLHQVLSADQGDIGLVFFKQPENFSPVTQLRLPTAHESDAALKRLAEDSLAQLLAPTSHQLRAHQMRKKLPYVFKDYRWLKNRTIRNVSEHLARSMRLYFADDQQKEKLISLVESITRQRVDEQSFISKMASAWHSKPIMTKYFFNLSKVCESESRLCAWVHDEAHHIEQTTGSCFGDSGAPMVWRSHRDSEEFLLLGVHTTTVNIYDQASSGCGGQKLNVSASAYREWILDAIDKERS